VKQLPSVRWKMFGLANMPDKKHKEVLEKLAATLRISL
jgi:hypothetical protein